MEVEGMCAGSRSSEQRKHARHTPYHLVIVPTSLESKKNMKQNNVAPVAFIAWWLLLFHDSEAFKLKFCTPNVNRFRSSDTHSTAGVDSPAARQTGAHRTAAGARIVTDSRFTLRRRKSHWLGAVSANSDGVGNGGATAEPTVLRSENGNDRDDVQDLDNVDTAAAPAVGPDKRGLGDNSMQGSLDVGEAAEPEDEIGGLVKLTDRGGVSKDRLAFEELGTREVDRLFSTLEACDVSGFRHKPGNLLSATALIGGTTVGAGILALPAATLQAGLIPSSVGLIMMWVYMAATGLLIAEVNVNVICRQGTPGVGLIALAEQALGKGGARFTGLVYVFIHYALLVAYMAQGGGLLNEAVNAFMGTGAETSVAGPPEWAGPTAFCLAVGSLLLFFSEEVVNVVNSVLVGVVLASFAGLVAVGSGGIQMEYLNNQDWTKVPATVPVMYIAMVFHNVVPVVTTQLEGDVAKIRKAVVGGSLAPLIMFLVWNAVILGTVPKDAGLVAEATGGVFDPLQALRQGAHVEEGAGALLGPLIAVFSEVAIVTSFIGFIVGLLDFFTDVLGIPPGDTSKEIPLYGAILLPPLAIAITDPDIFFAALDNAGTFGISLLCGVLPAAMAWSQRYSDADRTGGEGGGGSLLATLPLVPGGKATLAGIAGFAGIVIFQKLLQMTGLTI